MSKKNVLDISIEPGECAIETIATLNLANFNERENLRVDLGTLDSTFKEHIASIKRGDL